MRNDDTESHRPSLLHTERHSERHTERHSATSKGPARGDNDIDIERWALASLNVLGWGVVLSALYYIDRARPHLYKIDRFFGVHRRRTWDLQGVDYAFWLIIVGLAVSVLALVVELRATQKDTGLSKGTLALAVVSILAFFAHLLKFG